MWEGFPNVPWRYFSQPKLRAFLIERIADDFSFPLNPKWLLCDAGWWDVFEKLQASNAAQPALASWFPGQLREEMVAIHAAFPAGYAPTAAVAQEELDIDKAEWELGRFMTLQRAKAKLRAVHRLRKIGSSQE